MARDEREQKALDMFDIFEEFEGSNYPPILNSGHVTVIVSDKIVDEDKWIQKRTHHKKRINKKWRKRYGMIHPPLENCLLIGDILYVHPVTYKKVFKNFYHKGEIKIRRK